MKRHSLRVLCKSPNLLEEPQLVLIGPQLRGAVVEANVVDPSGWHSIFLCTREMYFNFLVFIVVEPFGAHSFIRHDMLEQLVQLFQTVRVQVVVRRVVCVNVTSIGKCHIQYLDILSSVSCECSSNLRLPDPVVKFKHHIDILVHDEFGVWVTVHKSS